MKIVNEEMQPLPGGALRSGDAGYDEGHHVWNARFDRRPDLVVRCHDEDEVAATVRWAAASGTRLSVKGGGHSYAGTTVADEGVLLDLSPMREVSVDAERRVVRVQAGATWAELDAATQVHGLATPGPTVSSVGVAGSTLGGGTGWLSRAFGNASDNLVAIELVTADGEQLRVDDSHEPDLFWAMRGAGANFGVVTAFEFRLHEVGPAVLAGQIIYPFDDAARLLRVYDEVMSQADDGFQCLPFMLTIPPIDVFPERFHGLPALDFVVFHLDPDATEAIAPLRGLGETILEAVEPVPYTVAQRAFDPNLPAGQRYYSKAHDLAGLDDATIETITTHVPRMTGAFSAAYLEPRGGAVARLAGDATAAGGRDAPYSFHVIAGWEQPSQDVEVMGWARGFHDAMADHATGGVYVNLLAEDEPERIPSAFSDSDRLRTLKRRWDGNNLFRGNHNIAPA